MLNNELKKVWPNMRYYSVIILEGLRKSTKILSLQSVSRLTFKREPPEYKSEMFPIEPNSLTLLRNKRFHVIW